MEEMSFSLLIVDEVLPGRGATQSSLLLPSCTISLRDLIRERVEIAYFHATRPAQFQGLMQPEELEALVNNRQPRTIDANAQFTKACAAFEQNGFLVFINDRQITGLDEVLRLDEACTVQFVKLVPLVGG
jgi:hypothetical protein